MYMYVCVCVCVHIYIYIQGVSGGIVNILGGGSMNYSEYISLYKHGSNFQWVWRYSCLNVTHKKPYKRYEGKTNDLFVTFIGYVNDLLKISTVQSKCSNIPPSTSTHFSTLLAIVRVALLRSSWHSCFMRAALFIMPATNSSLVFTIYL